jgi:hypothetical protein
MRENRSSDRLPIRTADITSTPRATVSRRRLAGVAVAVVVGAAITASVTGAMLASPATGSDRACSTEVEHRATTSSVEDVRRGCDEDDLRARYKMTPAWPSKWYAAPLGAGTSGEVFVKLPGASVG